MVRIVYSQRFVQPNIDRTYVTVLNFWKIPNEMRHLQRERPRCGSHSRHYGSV